MISALIRELVIPILVFLVVRGILRSLFGTFQSRRARQSGQATPPPAPAGGVLHKDPVCGTYVSADSGISATVRGRLTYFCSAECKNKFLAAS